MNALDAELLKLKAKMEADSAIAAQMAENQAAAAEPRVTWSPQPVANPVLRPTSQTNEHQEPPAEAPPTADEIPPQRFLLQQNESRIPPAPPLPQPQKPP